MPEQKPEYEPENLIEAWLAMTDAHDGAQNVEKFARYAAELGWRSILAVLEHPDARAHVSTLSGPLSIFISRFGADFIDRIEEEAAISSAFRECLAHVHPTPVFTIPETLWSRLSAAADVTIGPMQSKMASLYAELPDLAQLMAWDPHPLAAEDVPTLSDSELRAQAEAWVIYHQNYWAWEEIRRVLDEDGCEAAWPLVLALIDRASQTALGSIGAGILEDMLEAHGDVIIERVEKCAAADARFRYCLSYVWPVLPEPIWERVVRARGDEPQRG